MRLNISVLALAMAVAPGLLVAQQAAGPDPAAILEQAKAATVIVLAGEGTGRLHSIATGVVVSKDGEPAKWRFETRKRCSYRAWWHTPTSK